MNLTPTQVRLGIGAAGAALGIGAGLFFNARSRDHVREVRENGMGEWKQWRSALDQEFPDRALPTDGEERRFARFLEQNPPPKFLNIKYDDLRRVSIDSWEVESPLDVFRNDAIPLLGGGAAMAGGLALGLPAVQARLGKLGPAAALAGVGLLALGFASVSTSIASKFAPAPGPDVTRHIEQTEWHVPTHWSE